YPRAGILPRRSQAAPPIPAGYQPPGAPPVKAEPGVAQAAAQAPQAAEAPRGPYYAPEAAPAATESPEPPAAASESTSDQQGGRTGGGLPARDPARQLAQ